ncbi:hypothetical protein FNW52_10530 [Flavobacterium sp. ZT3R18]|uniref:hypothetical protein n=1 Tax=Flavobacterium sp. ZT3R18 TaxID=2594429 RepID=UPI00117AEBF7|nr:hypothetical protein [Flavobacterium sp. ZT3R18]TRX35469.1 hypothetical protein FNW52_10530 [Flavobacterium sp. ZT3R18]
MNIKIILNRCIYLMLTIITLSSLESCQSEDIVDNGLSDATVDPAFTIKPVEGSANKFTLVAQTKNALGSKWDLGNGVGLYTGKMTEAIFLPDAGTYTITHTVIGRGGVVNTTTQNIIVATPDPIAGNILKGGKLVDTADWGKWTITNPASSAKIVFGNGSATLTSSGWAGQGMYQAVNVVAGKKYVIDMVTSSTTGCNNTWLEMYCGYSIPVEGTDYSEGGKLRALSTWDGCAKAPFSGKISVVGCKPENNLGIFTATKTGVAYLVMRGGGEDMKAGIKIQNIEMRPSL